MWEYTALVDELTSTETVKQRHSQRPQFHLIFWVDFFLEILFTIVCPYHAACGIFVRQPGSGEAEVQSLNHWTTRDVPRLNFCSASLFGLSGDEVNILNNLYQNITGL